MTTLLQMAARVMAPYGNGETGEQAVYKVATTSASTSAQDTHVDGHSECAFVTFVCDQNCYIAFGATSSVAAADSNDWPLAANVPQVFVIYANKTRYFKAIRATADGTLKWYKSS